MIENIILRHSIERLMPDHSPEEAMATLLLDQARRRLVKYRGMNRRFREKYDTTFDEFREKMLTTELSFEEEQDYFDWELAIIGIGEMEREIHNLESLSQ